jgi:hypothetical protein
VMSHTKGKNILSVFENGTETQGGGSGRRLGNIV